MRLLSIQVDLDGIPEYGVPDELAVILREQADWIEKHPAVYRNPTERSRRLKNFEGQTVGYLSVEDRTG